MIRPHLYGVVSSPGLGHLLSFGVDSNLFLCLLLHDGCFCGGIVLCFGFDYDGDVVDGGLNGPSRDGCFCGGDDVLFRVFLILLLLPPFFLLLILMWVCCGYLRLQMPLCGVLLMVEMWLLWLWLWLG